MKEIVKKHFSSDVLNILIQELTKLMVNDPRLCQNHKSKIVYTTDRIHESQQQDLIEAVKYIQESIKQLDENYPSDTTADKIKIATEVITQIDNNPTIKERILRAIKAVGVAALEESMNHPAASLIIEGLNGWMEKD